MYLIEKLIFLLALHVCSSNENHKYHHVGHEDEKSYNAKGKQLVPPTPELPFIRPPVQCQVYCQIPSIPLGPGPVIGPFLTPISQIATSSHPTKLESQTTSSATTASSTSATKKTTKPENETSSESGNEDQSGEDENGRSHHFQHKHSKYRKMKITKKMHQMLVKNYHQFKGRSKFQSRDFPKNCYVTCHPIHPIIPPLVPPICISCHGHGNPWQQVANNNDIADVDDTDDNTDDNYVPGEDNAIEYTIGPPSQSVQSVFINGYGPINGVVDFTDLSDFGPDGNPAGDYQGRKHFGQKNHIKNDAIAKNHA